MPPRAPMEIDTPRFLLRDFREGDRGAFLAYQADSRYLALHGPEEADPAHAAGLLRTFALWAVERPRRNYQLAIIEKASQNLIGCCGLRRAGADEGSAELGVELAPDYWGRYGYALEVVDAVLGFGFGTLSLREIYGLTAGENARVACLARWFGAEEASPAMPSPAWMLTQGLTPVEWRITREKWAHRGGRKAGVRNRFR